MATRQPVCGPEWGKLQWSAGLFRTTLNQRHSAAVEHVQRLRLLHQRRHDLAPGRGGRRRSGPATGGRPTPTTPISTPSTSRPSWSRRRTIRCDRTLARRRREREHPDHQRHADRRHSKEYSEGRRRLRRDRQVAYRHGHGRGVGPGHLRQREQRGAASPRLRRLRPAHVLSDRQAGPDLRLRAEHFRSALLYLRRPGRHRGSSPIRSRITNPQTFGPAKPFAIYGGLRITL